MYFVVCRFTSPVWYHVVWRRDILDGLAYQECQPSEQASCGQLSPHCT